ncbi:hypothetical protein JCM10213_006045 [Rhodosporidiobolus nylandii]
MTDYLTNLPTELLEDILRRVQGGYRRPYLGLVCKAFLPIARNAGFRSLYICGSVQLTRLSDLVTTSPGVAASVKELTLMFTSHWPDNNTPSTKAVLTLFSRLTSLGDLTISGSTRLVKAVLSDTKTPRLFPSLVRLGLKDPFSGWANPFDPFHFLPLQRHKQLRNLEVDVDRTSESLGRYRSPKRIPILKSDWAFTVVLRGPLTTNEAAEDLLLSLPEVCWLWLEDRSLPSEGIVPLLENLPVPDRLFTLSIESDLHPSTFERLAGALPHFTALRTLQFLQDSFRPILLPALRELPNLAKLYFSSGPSPSAANVKALIAGPTQLLRLSFLVLGHIAVDWDAVKGPEFYDDFTRKDADEVLSLAASRQIEVSGQVIDWLKEEKDAREAEQARTKSGKGEAQA